VRELPPRGVQDALAKVASDHAFDVQVFNRDQVIATDVVLAQVVGKVPAGIGHAKILPLEMANRFAAVAATFPLPADGSVGALQLPFKSPKVSWSRHGRAVRADYEVGEPEIKPDGRFDGPLCGRRHAILDENLGEPAVRPSDDPQAALLPLDWPEIAAADRADAVDADASALGMSRFTVQLKRVPAIGTLKPWKTNLGIPCLASPEESLECPIQTTKGVTLNLNGDGRYGRIIRPPDSEHPALVVEADGFLSALVSLDPMVQKVVPDTTATAEIVEEPRLLLAGWVEPY